MQLKPAYALAQALDDEAAALAFGHTAEAIAAEQLTFHAKGAPLLLSAEVLKRLLDAPNDADSQKFDPFVRNTPAGRRVLTVRSVTLQGMTIRLHSGSGEDIDALAEALRHTPKYLEYRGMGLQR